MRELIVFPTPQLVEQYRAKAFEHKRGYVDDGALNYEVFVDRCIGPFVRPEKLLDDFKKNYILLSICKKLLPQLRYFTTIRNGYVERISDLIGELKRQDIDAETFKSLVRDVPRTRDLYRIFKAYEQFLSEKGLYDKEDRYILCKHYITKSEYIQDFDKIIFRDFYYFTVLQKKIGEALGARFEIANSPLARRLENFISNCRNR